MTAQLLSSYLTLPIIRIISLLIAVLLLLTLLASSGNHRQCNPMAEKSRLEGTIKRNIAVENALNIIIRLSMSVLHAIDDFINHLNMTNQVFSAEK
jgi:hypothetical protein